MGREQAKEAARKSEKCFVGQSGQVELTIAAVSPQLVFPPLSAHTPPQHAVSAGHTGTASATL